MTMKCLLFPFLVLVLVAATPGRVGGPPWGAQGHRIVASIAEGLLTDAAADAILEILGDESLADISTWPDKIRGDRRYDWVKPLHYINVPRSATSVDLSRDGRRYQNVVNAIPRFLEDALDERKPAVERRNALAFVVHFVGDVHQPLHVSYSDDKGGNSVRVRFFGSRRKLHGVWDTSMIARRAGGDWRAYAEELAGSIDEELQSELAGVVEPVDWANESLSYTRTTVYEFGDDHRLGEAYYDKNLPVVEDRLIGAGVRLAALLNAAFGTGVVVTVSEPDKIDAGLRGAELKSALQAICARGHQPLSYRQARRRMYGYVDRLGGRVTAIYSGESFSVGGDGRVDSNEINCEHLWPQSKGARVHPRRSDIYHLRPSRPRVNQARANYPFGSPEGGLDGGRWRVGQESDGDTVMLPPQGVRGDIARSLFYFSIRYDLRISSDEEEDLRSWHEADPVDEAERQRCARVKEVQGNENPFVSAPELVGRISDF